MYTQTRLANNLWRQPRPADSVDFPYGCVTVIMACPEDTQSEDGGPGGAGERDSWWHPTHLPPWLQGMVDTNKLVEVGIGIGVPTLCVRVCVRILRVCAR